MAVSTPVFAQNAGAAAGAAQMAPGTNGIPPVGTTPNPGSAGISPAPGGQSTTGTGITTGTGTGQIPGGAGANQPGVPNTSTPGMIGTGGSPSGLPGDDPVHPGFPGKVGK
ncbi:hypothetical protein JQ628_23150 [Bradyrhizobium lablabi]|nr:hypothetical protein [Bradyrhizobium lablabi]